ncbi:pilus assembly protein TadG-related protein [Promicromonospora sp. NPDC023987]|uniref:pilus assembly protein TadG-related protein n=1 Tax=Promicromonospora sp. NPDC023987 TaxID=3155360 RepID=UPI0033C573C0
MTSTEQHAYPATPDRRALRDQAGEQTGSVSVWMVTACIGLILIVGVVLDLGSQLHAQQRAYTVAAQAARTGGQQLDAASVLAGGDFAVDSAAAVDAASAFLAESDMPGTAWVEGDQVRVTVHDTYTPQVLGRIGLGPFPVEVTASARLIRVVGGAEQ